jgi:hypothetical protein
MKFQRRGNYDLMHTKTKELGWKENLEIPNTLMEDSQENIMVDQRKVLKIWENSFDDLIG